MDDIPWHDVLERAGALRDPGADTHETIGLVDERAFPPASLLTSAVSRDFSAQLKGRMDDTRVKFLEQSLNQASQELAAARDENVRLRASVSVLSSELATEREICASLKGNQGSFDVRLTAAREEAKEAQRQVALLTGREATLLETERNLNGQIAQLSQATRAMADELKIKLVKVDALQSTVDEADAIIAQQRLEVKSATESIAAKNTEIEEMKNHTEALQARADKYESLSTSYSIEIASLKKALADTTEALQFQSSRAANLDVAIQQAKATEETFALLRADAAHKGETIQSLNKVRRQDCIHINIYLS